MRIHYIALLISASIPATTLAATQTDSMEAKIARLEASLAKAEAQIARLAQAQQTPAVNVVSAEPPTSPAPTLTLSGYGDLRFYGDVEFNMDAASRSGSLTSMRTSANKDWAPSNNERWDINGRLLLGFDGYRRMDNGQFAGFSAQPLADLTGKMNLDDAVFFFGQENDWKIKVGRFEAYDMFPLNQDTFIEYSGNTANDLYSDGYGYIYMMKEGRGRSDSGGNFLLSKNLGNWYFEVNTLLENGSSLFVDKQYHGMDLDNDKNVAYVRPVIAWSEGRFTTALAMESNLVNNAYGYRDAEGHWIDQSDRTGYGLTMNWNGQKTDPDNGMVVNLNTAYMDASDETDFTAGVNGLWKNIELGYIYAHNEIDRFSAAGLNDDCDGDCWITHPGDYDIHTLHASYLFPDVMKMKNFNVYLGAYASWIDADPKEGDGDTDARYGGRLRFKYYF
ncbi:MULTISPECIES: carbohydrate porin [Leclercia]|uniref:carbohydrate porin n=3 Tax=Enterobacteriaceae TaxID=543 RepID=UPI00133132F2|nr:MULTISPECIES: carbohydrate porin [Leclercia]